MATTQTQPARPLIVLDPGHGIYRSVNPHTGAVVNRGPAGDGIINDTGAVHRATGTTEAQINDAMSARIALSMRNRNYDVALTRRIDVNSPMLRDISATDRAYLTQLNQSAPELLPDRFNARVETGAGRKVLHLSVHANAADAPSARGVEFYTHNTHRPGDVSNGYAAQLRQEFQGAGLLNTQQHLTSLNTAIIPPGPYDGVREALRNNGSPDRHVVRGLGTGMAAAVAELGYVTNPQDFARLTSPQGQQQMADLVATATDRFQQSRGHTMSTGQQRPTPAATPAAPQRQPQTVAPFVGNITQTGLDDPRVKNTIDRLQAWNQTLPEGRRNDALASADMTQPQNRLNLLMHFKRDQNAHAGGRYDLNNAGLNPMVGNGVNTALAAFAAAQPTPAATPQAPAQSTAPQPPAPAATPPAAGTAPAARPAAPAPTAPAAAVPVPPVRPSMPSPDGLVPKATGRTTPEQRAERHTENGLRVLGITNGSMSAEERAAKLKEYATGAGLPENATPAQIREQVGKDIRALQERLRDANNADASKGHYNLGRFGQNGVDGIAGAYTQGALRRFEQDNPGQTALSLIGRPNSAVAAAPARTPAAEPPAAPAAATPAPAATAPATPPAAPSATTPAAPAPSAASTTTPATPPAGTTPPAAPSAAVTPSATPAAQPTEAQRQSAQFTVDAARIPILRGNPLLDLQQSPPIDPASIITGPTGPSMEDRLRAARAAAGPSHDEFLRAFNLAPTPAPAPSAAAPADGVTRQGIQDALRIPPEHRTQAPESAAPPVRTDALPPDVLNQAAAATSGSQRFDVAQAETIGTSNAPNGKPVDKSTSIT